MGPLFPLRVVDKLMKSVCVVRADGGGGSTSRKTLPAPLCPLHITTDVPWDRMRAFNAKARIPAFV